MRDFRGNERFQVLRRLGAGGMGAVYEVEDHERRQRVALKLLTQVDADNIYRFKREFRAVAGLGHPNLVALYDLFVSRDEAFFTMELVRGTEFVGYCLRDSTGVLTSEATAELTAPSGPRGAARAICDESRLRPAFAQLVQGLAALHVARMIHRDVKPSNVLVSREGRTVVLDFGLVADASRDSDQSLLGMLAGTIDYMSPEQASANQALTPASDWYSVGVMLYEALTGCLPFRGERLEAMYAKLRTEPPPPRAIDPSVPPDLDELCARLLRKQPEVRPGPDEILAALGVSTPDRHARPRLRTESGDDHAFVGRTSEQAEVTAALERAAAGEATTVFITGPSGVGKSELVRRTIEGFRALTPGLTVLSGRCYEHEAIAYRAIDPLIDHLSRHWSRLEPAEAAALVPKRASALRRLFPVLGRVPALAEIVDRLVVMDPQEVRAQAFGALRELLSNLARHGPLVVVLDDLQWIDADTAALLADVMQPPAPPLLLLLLSRDLRADAEPSNATAIENSIIDSAVTRASTGSQIGKLVHALHDVLDLPIGPLSSIEAVRLAGLLLGPGHDELALRIARESRGNPFLITELARFVETHGAERSISLRIEDLVGERVAQLTPGSRALLEVVAVADEPLRRDIAAAAAGLDADAIDRELRALRVARLAHVSGDNDLIEPYHNRIREAISTTLSSRTLRKRHKALALALERFDEGAIERLARHWLGAGNHARAAQHATEAASRAERKLDFDRAADLYQIALVAGRPADEQRSELLAQLARARANAGRPGDAASAFLAAASHAAPGDRLELRRRAAEQLLQGGHLLQGVEVTRTVLLELGMSLPATPRRALLSIFASHARIFLRGLSITERHERELAPAELTRIDTCWAVGTGLSIADPLRGADYLFRHLRLALRAGEPVRAARGLALASVLLSAHNRGRGADAMLARAEELAQAGGADAVDYVTFAEGWQAYRRNQFEAATHAFADAARSFQRARSSGWETDVSRIFHCFALMWRGCLRELAARVPAYIRDAERRGDRFATVSLRARFALVHLLRNDIAAARDMVESGIRRWVSPTASFQLQHFFAAYSRCEIALYEGDPIPASEGLARTAEAMRANLITRIPVLRLELEVMSGRLALAAGDAASAEAAARRVRRISQAVSAPMAALLASGAHQLRGRDEDAVAALEHAEAGFERLGLALHLAAARYRRGELIGASAGDELRERANAWLRGEGVVAPESLLATVAPTR